jgi:polynucleotide 5'-hydroxyl-kinase GRC3/NOL9
VEIEIPPTWEQITMSALSGVILVVGAPDTGKSTFTRYLYRCLCAHHERVGFIDGDMGQATLGPPTTMTVALNEPGDDAFPPAGSRYRAFVGNVMPKGHMLPTLVGAHRLVRKAQEEGTSTIVFDTTGLIDPAQGGGELKRAKVDLLKPAAVIALQRRDELEYLLLPLRLSRRTRVIDLPASRAAQRRTPFTRQEHRAAQFRRCFAGARSLEVDWQRLAIFPTPAFTPHRLVALEDKEGFALSLGIVTASDPNTVMLHTPLASLDGVSAVRLGDLTLDPRTFQETRIRRDLSTLQQLTRQCKHPPAAA